MNDRFDNRIVTHWADFFGVEASALFDGRVHIVPHRALAGYQGAWVFRCETTTIISVPEDMVESVMSHAATLSILSTPSDAILRQLFSDRVSSLIGPAYQGFISIERFQPVIQPPARPAAARDKDGLQKLASACSEVDWEHSSIGLASDQLFVALENGVIVAAASAKPQDGVYPSIGFVTHPAHRGKGFGIAVAGAAAADALKTHPIVLWQTLLTNTGSIKIAERLGAMKFAESYAARLGPVA